MGSITAKYLFCRCFDAGFLFKSDAVKERTVSLSLSLSLSLSDSREAGFRAFDSFVSISSSLEGTEIKRH